MNFDMPKAGIINTLQDRDCVRVPLTAGTKFVFQLQNPNPLQALCAETRVVVGSDDLYFTRANRQIWVCPNEATQPMYIHTDSPKDDIKVMAYSFIEGLDILDSLWGKQPPDLSTYRPRTLPRIANLFTGERSPP